MPDDRDLILAGVKNMGEGMINGDTWMHDVLRDVRDERESQVQRGHSSESDSHYLKDELGNAGIAMAKANLVFRKLKREGQSAPAIQMPQEWPFGAACFSPTSGRETMVKAIALLVAHVEQLDRHEALKKEREAAEDKGENGEDSGTEPVNPSDMMHEAANRLPPLVAAGIRGHADMLAAHGY